MFLLIGILLLTYHLPLRVLLLQLEEENEDSIAYHLLHFLSVIADQTIVHRPTVQLPIRLNIPDGRI